MTNNSIFGGASLADSSVAVAPSSLSGAYNKRVCGSLHSPKLPCRATSHTRWPLCEMPESIIICYLIKEVYAND